MSNDNKKDLDMNDDTARRALFVACSWWDYDRFCQALEIAQQRGPGAAEKIRALTNEDLAEQWKELNLADLMLPKPPEDFN